jgi:hypothetical protein
MSAPAQKYLVIARQAGSAAALAPVVRGLRARGDVVLVSAATAAARTGFGVVGVAPEVELPLESSVEWLAGWLEETRVTCVLTGTSSEPRLDGRFWSAARKTRVPAVALLDHWCNYAERFSDRARFDNLPDALAVMDEVAASTLSAVGFPVQRLHITGHPHLAEIAPITPAERIAARNTLRVSNDRPVITFLSQPTATGIGHTTRGALETVRFAVAQVRPDALVVLRPHPREDMPAALAGEPETVVVRAGGPRGAIAATDVMTGMTSILLLEAALSGVATLSVRPNGGPDEYIDAHADLIVSLTDSKALPAALHRALTDSRNSRQLSRVRRTASGGEAADRVIRLLDNLSRRSQSGAYVTVE